MHTCDTQGVATPAFWPCAAVDGLHAWPCYVVTVLVAMLWASIVAVLTWRILTHRRTGVYMLDFACFAPPCACALRSCMTLSNPSVLDRVLMLLNIHAGMLFGYLVIMSGYLGCSSYTVHAQ